MPTTTQHPQLPPVLYHGTSSRCLSSILYGGLNPVGSYSGRILLTPDINAAVQDAIERTQWDRFDAGWQHCQSVLIYPIVCRIDTKMLTQHFITPQNSIVTSGFGNRMTYTQVIPIKNDDVIRIPFAA